MKKTISINISGIVFHIEEDGYDKLKKYLASIQRYFSNYEDSVEIISDIEGRIAEIFLAKLDNTKQIVTLADVEKLMATMGNVADFEAIEDEEDLQGRARRAHASGRQSSSTAYEQTTASATTADRYTATGPKKLYRDDRRKLLGGVAAGIAHYFSIDPLWVRLLFLTLFFGLFFIPPASGFIFLLYIILWVVVPGSMLLEDDQKIKKLYRDPDRRVIGGVAAGLASYFKVDETAIRLLFVIGLFLFGQGLIIYLVLWAITPEAKTLTDKMQMQGEPVTLSNIESNIKKSLNVNENEEESAFVKILLFPFRLIAPILNGLGPVFRFAFDALRVVVGIFLVFLSLVIMVGLLVALAASLGWMVDPQYWQMGDIPVEMLSRSFSKAGFIFIFISLFIPTLFVGLIGVVMIARRKLIPAPLGWTLFSVWVLSLIGVGITAPAFANAFRSRGYVEKVQNFDIANKTLVLHLRDAGNEDYNNTKLTLEGYEGPQVKLLQEFKASGRNRSEATANAEMISYSVAQDDSILTFDSNFAFMDKALFRGQELEMTLQIPYEQKFVMHRDLAQILRNTIDDNGYEESQMEDNLWKFSKDSALVCLTCKEGPHRNREGRYEGRSEDDNHGNDNNGDDESEFTSGIYSDEDNVRADDDGYTKQFNMKNFDKLEMGSAFIITVNQGNTFKVSATGDRDDVDDLEVDVKGNTLEIGYENNGFRFMRRKRVRIDITMPTLRGVQFSGATRSTINGFDSGQPMSIDISGASKSEISLRASTLDVDVSGASVVNIKGQSERLNADISGASTLNTFDLTAQMVEVETSGASTARVNALKSLRADASGASSVRYRGNPTTLSNDASGASSVKRE